MQQLMENFITLIQEVWAAGSFGIGMGNMLLALAIFLFFAVLRGLFARFVLGWLGRLTARTKTEIDDMLREAIERPLKFFFVVLGVFFAKESLALTGLPAELADNVMRSLVAIALFWAIYAASTPAAIGLRRIEDVLSPEIVSGPDSVALGNYSDRSGNRAANLGYSDCPYHCRFWPVWCGRGAGRAGLVQKSARRSVYID